MTQRSTRFGFRKLRFWQGIALSLLALFPAAAAEESGAKFQGVPVLPGKTSSVSVPLSAEEKTYAAIGGNRVGSGLRMEAKEIGLGAQKQILVTVGDPGNKAGAIAVHVYFVAKGPNGGARFIYANSDLLVKLRGSGEASAKVNMAELKSDPTRRAPVGFVLAGVGEMDGWIAIAQTNGKTFQVRASSPALLDVAQERSHDSLNAMIADYEKRTAEPSRRH